MNPAFDVTPHHLVSALLTEHGVIEPGPEGLGRLREKYSRAAQYYEVSVEHDEASGKATWVRVEGLEKAELRTRRYGRRGLRKLEAALPPGPSRERLLGLGRLMWNRDH